MRVWQFMLTAVWLLVSTPLLPGAETEATAPSTPSGTALAAQPAKTTAERGLPLSADRLGGGDSLITNSMVVCVVVALGLIVFAQVATRKMDEVPTGAQNFWEWLVEGLHDFLESVMGRELVGKTFWFLATIFIFILFTNWFGLLPGVGTVGWGVPGEHGFEVTHPLLRGGNADLNMTFAMSSIFMVLWLVWALQINGIKGFLLHLFGPKGENSGALRYFMILVFFAVGLLECLSIAFRPISLSFRLFGNIFAGENLLEAMSNTIQHPAWARALFSVVLPIPFYFLELLVGLVQALVFMLLTAVFTALICTHEDEPGKASH
ncbi:MAG: F0F1 ATP synthase subunit A [Verrucomicrobia bacterium]|nr:F0F1 ATP synthase subunit A [Verrucomicrobiota bacterium]